MFLYVWILASFCRVISRMLNRAMLHKLCHRSWICCLLYALCTTTAKPSRGDAPHLNISRAYSNHIDFLDFVAEGLGYTRHFFPGVQMIRVLAVPSVPGPQWSPFLFEKLRLEMDDLNGDLIVIENSRIPPRDQWQRPRLTQEPVPSKYVRFGWTAITEDIIDIFRLASASGYSLPWNVVEVLQYLEDPHHVSPSQTYYRLSNYGERQSIEIGTRDGQVYHGAVKSLCNGSTHNGTASHRY